MSFRMSVYVHTVTFTDGLRLLGRRGALDMPLRLPDLDTWTRSLGCAPFPVPCGAFRATPLTTGRWRPAASSSAAS